jgi:O-antigen/teichoic acid export membrane protein
MQSSTDFLLLGQFHYSERLGPYSAAMKILSIPQGIIFALISAMYPRFARYSEDLLSQDMRETLMSTTRLIWIILVPMVIGSCIFGDQLILWFFGPHYIGAGRILKPLSFAYAFYFLGLAPMSAILLSHKTSKMIRISLLNLTISFGSALLVLLFGKPDLLPWAMVFAQAFFMIASWRPFGGASQIIKRT